MFFRREKKFFACKVIFCAKCRDNLHRQLFQAEKKKATRKKTGGREYRISASRLPAGYA